MSSPLPPPPAPKRPFWVRRVRDPIVQQLTQGFSPDRIALTLAIGTVLGLFPIIGTTSLLCFATAWALRLNQPLIQMVNQLLWPVHLAAILPCIHFGDWLVDAHDGPVDLRKMGDLFWSSPREFFHEFGAVTFHAIVGWAVLAPFVGFALYLILKPVILHLSAALGILNPAGSASLARPPKPSPADSGPPPTP
ncbi:DUF2062 domain-containing protein [Nibricoccus sp. IMCC34717]|uniref:DUF2062 domain-containing protein n=1 Tax=Nibricoccus sp. IMCC34717 TaxID=3034021 RepID=UPI00384C473A